MSTVTDIAPAPWRFDGHGINDAEGQRITKVSACGPYDYHTPNPMRNSDFDTLSNLIAAAPEMLEALEAVEQLLREGFLVRDTRGDGDPDWAIKVFPKIGKLNLMRAAIRKAKGEL